MGGKKFINIFGQDVPFYSAQAPKFEKSNFIGLSTLLITKTAIVKNREEQVKFTWTSSTNIHALSKVIYHKIYNPEELGQTKFLNVNVKVGNTI